MLSLACAAVPSFLFAAVRFVCEGENQVRFATTHERHQFLPIYDSKAPQRPSLFCCGNDLFAILVHVIN